MKLFAAPRAHSPAARTRAIHTPTALRGPATAFAAALLALALFLGVFLPGATLATTLIPPDTSTTAAAAISAPAAVTPTPAATASITSPVPVCTISSSPAGAISASTIAATPAPIPASVGFHYTLSMERPNLHYFHVVMRAVGLPGATAEFRMPAWSPGYYKIVDYAGNVINFRAVDGSGRVLAWEKTAKNAWKVKTEKAPIVEISYDVYGFNRHCAESYLGDDSAFIVPTGTFMYAAGMLKLPATVEIRPLPGWTRVATGLDPVAGKPNQFSAPDFDTLYDSPILAGRLETLAFEVKGVPHEVAAVDLTGVDKGKFTADLKRMVESATSIIGDLPYKHYTFLMIGDGRGGLEHLNSAALTYQLDGLVSQPDGYMSFVAHEFFHLYNVKRIRPIALGPFDYDRENYTRMLWVSEGLTVYYEYLILNRAGLMPRDAALGSLGDVISIYEQSPGRYIQSATSSSFDTWLNSYSRNEHTANTTVSYYDAGAVLGLLLDLKIRHESLGKASLDDVMRTIYREYYQKKKRGFTDDEFRAACEKAAGTDLSEIFVDYAEKAAPIDYAKYLAPFGLKLEEYREHEGAVELPWFGAIFEGRNDKPVISRIEWRSPAAEAGLSSGDEIAAINGGRFSSGRDLDWHLAHFKPGDTVSVQYFRNGKAAETMVKLGTRPDKAYRIVKDASPTPDQKALLENWLK